MCQNIPDLMSLCFLIMCFKLNRKLTFLSKRRLLSTSRVVNAVPSPTARAVNANLKSIIVSTLLDVFFSSISVAHASTGQWRFFQIFTNPASSISFILEMYQRTLGENNYRITSHYLSTLYELCFTNSFTGNARILPGLYSRVQHQPHFNAKYFLTQ